MSSVFGWFNKSKKPHSAQASPAATSVPLGRTTSSPTSVASSLHDRFKRPRLKTTKTAPGRLPDLLEEPHSSQALIHNLSRTESTPTDYSTAPNTALNVFKLALVTLSSASDNIPAPGLKVAVDILLTVVNGIQTSEDNNHGFRLLTERMVRIDHLLLSLHKVEANMAAAMPFFESMETEFKKLATDIEQFSSQGKLALFFNSSENASDLTKHSVSLDSIINDCTLAISIDQLSLSTDNRTLSMGTDRRVAEVQHEIKQLAAGAMTKDQLERFNSLNQVAEAAYNSSAREFATGCLAGTRAAVLKTIHNWVDDSSSTMVFWLNGAAGTGKSAVAHSIAQAYDNEHRLGGSFFFTRDQQARRETKYLFQTIAFHLGSAYPALKVEIAESLDDQTILTSNLQRQVHKLIFEPLSKVKLPSPPIVVVLDALDEADNEDAVSHVIQLVANPSVRHLPIKFFITSRPETHIRSTFQSPEVGLGTSPFVLHDMEASDIRQDIQAFIRHELAQIADNCRDVLRRDSWPKEHEVEALVDLSAELFIAAATALKFIRPIRGSRDPRVRLAMILDSAKKGSATESRAFHYLDRMYTEILKNATGGEPSDVLRTVVGAVVLAFGRLTAAEWAELLQTEDDISAALADLQSVIIVPEGDTIRTFHRSFRDFLTDHGRCTDEKFFVDSPRRHMEMARSCLQRMNGSLKRDICAIRDPTKMNREVYDLDKKKVEHLPGDLQYACRFWALHLSESSPVEPLFELLQSFVFTSILYWIEVLSLIGDLGGGLKSLRQAQTRLSSVDNLPSGLLDLLRDAERFLFDFYDGISMSALHTYYSALPFSPKGTLLYRTFISELRGAPNVVSGVGDRWGACLRTMEGHSDSVMSVAISQDGNRVVSSSSDKTIRIWDAQTGAVSHIFEGHSGTIRSVRISQDGTRIVSGSDDETLRIWDTQSGVALHTLKWSPCPVRAVAISHDGTRVISGSVDTTVRIWDAQTGEELHVLNGHSGGVVALAMAKDDSKFVSGSDDATVRIWDTQTGAALHELKGHSYWINSVAISNDTTLVVSSSYDTTIRIWDALTGTSLHRLVGHSVPVRSVAISHDGNRIISGSDDQTIRFWDIRTGAALHCLSGHSNSVWSVAFSPDDGRIISGSYDGVICIWDAQITTSLELDGHSSAILAVTITDDGNRVISGSYDDTVCIWDAHSGAILHRLVGHSSSVRSVGEGNHGKLVVSGSDDETIRVWDALTGEALHELKGHTNWVRSVAKGSDSNRIISGSYDTTIRIWDAQTGASLHELRGHSGPVLSVARSSDDKLIISGSTDDTIRIWDAQSGIALHCLKGHSDSVKSVAISNDSSRFVSGSYDRTIRIWDTKTGTALHELTIPGSMLPDVSFSPDESNIVIHGCLYPIPLHSRPLSPPQVVGHRPTYGLQSGWIVEGGKRRCWIPLSYRGVYAGSTPLVALGTPRGKLIFLRFPLHT